MPEITLKDVNDNVTELRDFIVGGEKNCGRGMQQDITSIMANLARITNTLDHLADQQEGMKDRMNHHSGELKVIHSTLAAHEERLDKLEALNASTTKDLTQAVIKEFKANNEATRVSKSKWQDAMIRWVAPIALAVLGAFGAKQSIIDAIKHIK